MTKADVRTALQAALAFLDRAQSRDGGFAVGMAPDRHMALSEPSYAAVFPTALAIDVLANVPGAEQICRRGASFLLQERDDSGLWRYWVSENPDAHKLPPDCDDTAAAGSALRACGRGELAGRDLLLANRDSRGLFYTWFAPRTRWSGREHMAVCWRQLRHVGWQRRWYACSDPTRGDVDAVVNANVLSYLGAGAFAAPVIAHLLGVLDADAEMACDKYYEDPFVVWYSFARALQVSSPGSEAAIAPKVESATPDSALQLCLAALTLSLCNGRGQEQIAELLRVQSSDGSWPRAGLYCSRDNFAAVPGLYWGSEALTTAYVVAALSGYVGQG